MGDEFYDNILYIVMFFLFFMPLSKWDDIIDKISNWREGRFKKKHPHLYNEIYLLKRDFNSRIRILERELAKREFAQLGYKVRDFVKYKLGATKVGWITEIDLSGAKILNEFGEDSGIKKERIIGKVEAKEDETNDKL